MALKDLNTTTVPSWIVREDGTVFNFADLLTDDRVTNNVLRKINVDATGRLRVAVESTATIGTVSNVTTSATIGSTAIGSMTAVARAQMESNMQFQGGFSRNLVRT